MATSDFGHGTLGIIYIQLMAFMVQRYVFLRWCFKQFIWVTTSIIIEVISLISDHPCRHCLPDSPLILPVLGYSTFHLLCTEECWPVCPTNAAVIGIICGGGHRQNVFVLFSYASWNIVNIISRKILGTFSSNLLHSLLTTMNTSVLGSR